MYRGFKGFALVKLANLPLLDRLADLIYPWFARNRYRFPAWLLPVLNAKTAYAASNL